MDLSNNKVRSRLWEMKLYLTVKVGFKTGNWQGRTT